MDVVGAQLQTMKHSSREPAKVFLTSPRWQAPCPVSPPSRCTLLETCDSFGSPSSHTQCMCVALALLLLARRQRLPAPIRVPRSAAAATHRAAPASASKQRPGAAATAAAGSWSLNDLVEGAEIVCMAAAAALVAYSRVYLKYHSLEQVRYRGGGIIRSIR